MHAAFFVGFFSETLNRGAVLVGSAIPALFRAFVDMPVQTALNVIFLHHRKATVFATEFVVLFHSGGTLGSNGFDSGDCFIQRLTVRKRFIRRARILAVAQPLQHLHTLLFEGGGG